MTSLKRGPRRLIAAYAVSAFGNGLALPFVVVYLHQTREIGTATVGLLVGSSAVASLLCSFVGGWGADSFGARRTAVVGTLLQATGFGLLAATGGLAGAIAGEVTLGAGNGLFFAAWTSLLADMVMPRDRPRVFGAQYLAINLGAGAGALVAAVVLSAPSVRRFQALLWLDATTFVALGAAITALAPGRSITTRKVVPGGLRLMVRDRQLRVLTMLQFLVVAFGLAQLDSGLPLYATSRRGVSASGVGWLIITNTVAVVAVQWLVVRRTALWRRTSLLRTSAAASLVAWSLGAATGIMDKGGAILVLAAAMAIFAVSECFYSPAFAPLVNGLAPDGLRGRYNGATSFAYSGGRIAGPAFGAAAVGAGRWGIWILLVAAAAAALALTFALPSRTLADTSGPTGSPRLSADAG